jgi:hypothetical protein
MEPWLRNYLFKLTRKMKGDDLSKSSFFLANGLLIFSFGLYVGSGISESLTQYRRIKMVLKESDSPIKSNVVNQLNFPFQNQPVQLFSPIDKAVKSLVTERLIFAQPKVIESVSPDLTNKVALQKVEQPPTLNQVSRNFLPLPGQPVRYLASIVETEKQGVGAPKIKAVKVTNDKNKKSKDNVKKGQVLGIQLGAFPDEKSAIENLKKYKAGDKPYYIVSSIKNGKNLWRVCTGTFDRWSVSEAYKKDLLEKKIGEPGIWVNKECGEGKK